MKAAASRGQKAVWGLFLALCLSSLPQCSGRDSAPLPVESVPGAELPPQRPAWLAPLQRAHQLADAATNSALRGDALLAFDNALANLPPVAPGATGFTPAQIWVRQDAFARAAQLELDSGHAEGATARAERGLELGAVPSVPVATLHTLRGRALEALGATEAAVGAYHSALVINQQLMDRALDTNEKGAP